MRKFLTNLLMPIVEDAVSRRLNDGGKGNGEDRLPHWDWPFFKRFKPDVSEEWCGAFGGEIEDARAAFTRAFTGQEGEHVLQQIFIWAAMYEDVTLDGDALQRREGAREICVRILKMINANVTVAELPAVMDDQTMEE